MAAATSGTKQQKEAAFHDEAFSTGLRENVSKFYLIMDGCHGFYRDHLRRHAPGATILELGCGQDSNAIFLAKQGAAEVNGIDISQVAIDQADGRAAAESVTNVRFQVMDAEKLEFADNSFDLICGVAILHHLDLDKTLSELARTLRPGGTAIFLEPLAHNPVINFYRRMTPSLRTEDEHPLTVTDLANFKRYFARIDKRYFHLLSLALAPFHSMPGFERLVHVFDKADRTLFAAASFLGRYAWTVGLVFSSPVKPAGGTAVKRSQTEAAEARR